MKCRHCAADLQLTFLDLGSAPPSNAYLTKAALAAPEKWYPLRILVCERCWLVQTEDSTEAPELFDPEYSYFSSTSRSWLEHSERYAEEMCRRFGLGPTSHVVEIAANDGYLLQYFKSRRVLCTGVEPTAGTAAAARAKGIDIVERFFGAQLAEELVADGKSADLMAANNVLAHVPALGDFVAGFRILLRPSGVATFELPHLCRLVADSLFDTVYHEHFSYFSLTAVESVFAANGLAIFDVEELPTHGGSLRVFAQRGDTGVQPRGPAVDALLRREASLGVGQASYYRNFQGRVDKIKDDFVAFLLDAKRRGETVAGYGAAAKGNTLLNYAGVRGDLVRFIADGARAKQGKFMPGSRIPIVDKEAIRSARPSYVVIFPWNLKDEIVAQLGFVRDWGGKFVTALPSLQVLP